MMNYRSPADQSHLQLSYIRRSTLLQISSDMHQFKTGKASFALREGLSGSPLAQYLCSQVVHVCRNLQSLKLVEHSNQFDNVSNRNEIRQRPLQCQWQIAMCGDGPP